MTDETTGKVRDLMAELKQSLVDAGVSKPDENDRLRARVAELERDKARLDWLDGVGRLTTYRDRDPEDNALSHCVVVPEDRVSRRGFIGNNWRAAIDAARQAEKETTT